MRSLIPRLGARRSLGGRVVEDSLARVGFALTPGVQIVETAAPRPRGADVVLVQNAWNFLPDDEFADLSRPYPEAMRRRMRQRRLLAALNVRRADRVVALTAPMADLVAQRTGHAVEVSEVLHPLDVLDAGDDPSGVPAQPFVLVPGTITWYKDPLVAIALVASRAELPRRVLLAGSDDGSGCWPEVRRFAGALEVEVIGAAVPRPVMLAALRRASAVLIPSRLESLGFSLTEALAVAPGQVIASPLPSHRDLAERVGRSPIWMGAADAELSDRAPRPPRPDDLRASWVALGHRLGLPGKETA